MKYLTVFIILKLSLIAFAETNSEKFRYLENDPAAVNEIVNQSNSQVSLSLKKSLNYDKIARSVKITDHGFRVKKTETINNNLYTLVDLGMRKDIQIIKTSADSKETIIYSQFSESKNQRKSIIDFSISPDEKFLIVFLYTDGSTEHYEIRMLNLENNQQIPIQLNASSTIYIWQNKTQLWLQSTTSTVTEINLNNLKTKTYENTYLISNEAYVFEQNSKYFYQNTLKQQKTQIPILTVQLNETANFVYFINETNQLTHIKKGDPRGELRTTALRSNNILETGSLYLDSYYVKYSEGEKVWFDIFNSENKVIETIHVPIGLNFYLFQNSADIIEIYAISPFKSQLINYDLKNHRIIEENYIDDLYTYENEKYESVVQFSKSSDQTLVTYVMIRKSNLKNNSKNPVLMNVYGGFGYSYRFYTHQLDAHELSFLQNNGTLVGVAPRGSSEYGQNWHFAGKLKNKKNTFADVASVSEDLIKQNFTNADRIILTGTSNGGLVAAATGLLYPHLFGLIIPVNGLQDMLAKERLDAKFFKGWSYEYGDSTDPELYDYIQSYSPVEMASTLSANSNAQFLLLVGMSDNRVNPLHTIKLKAAFDQNTLISKDKVRMYAIKNSGHHILLKVEDDVRNWRTKSIYWSAIYDQAKIRYIEK